MAFFSLETSKTVIDGYLRRIQDETYKQIDVINDLCVQFLFEPEAFDPNTCSKDIKIEDHTITKLNRDGYTTTYSTQWIDSASPYILKWTFKINKKSGTGGMVIGISSIDTESDEHFCNTKTSRNYCYYHQGSIQSRWVNTRYGEAYGAGDVITMELNLIKRTLSYNQNGKDLGTAYVIEQGNDIRYKLAISLYQVADSISWCSFEQFYATE